MKPFLPIAELHRDIRTKEAIKDGKTLLTLFLSVPGHCHLNCSYCFASESRRDKENTIGIEKYREILDDFSKNNSEQNKNKCVSIPGDGEPFHKQNWPIVKMIIESCYANGIKLTIFTTGSLLLEDDYGDDELKSAEDRIKFLEDRNVFLLVKYNHSNPAIQDALVGDNSRSYSVNREKILRKLFERKNNESNQYIWVNTGRLGLVTSIIKENSQPNVDGNIEIVNIFNHCQSNGLVFDCDTILGQGDGKSFIEKETAITQKELLHVFDQLKAVGACHSECQGGTYVGNTCDRILHHLYVKSNGDVYPCIGCSNDKLSKVFKLGNVNESKLLDLWLTPLRQKLSQDRKKIFTGTCSLCENFQSDRCYSCFGRYVIEVSNHGNNNLTLETIGCIHHKPISSTFLSNVSKYVREVVREPQTLKLIKERKLGLGLEELWRPNRNLAFILWQLNKATAADIYSDLIQKVIELDRPHEAQEIAISRINSYDIDTTGYSLRKHYNYSKMNFPLNETWDFIKDPALLCGDHMEKDPKKFFHELSKSFLSNTFLSSLKILFDKYDSHEKNILFSNIMFYDSLRDVFFYRSIVKNEIDVHYEEKEVDKSLVILSWFEDYIDRNGNRANLWKEYCYDLSASLRTKVFEDYELKLSIEKDETVFFDRHKMLDISPLLDVDFIYQKADQFSQYLDSVECKELYPDIEEILKSKIYIELEDDQRDVLVKFYEAINKHSFFASNIQNRYNVELQKAYVKFVRINTKDDIKIEDNYDPKRLLNENPDLNKTHPLLFAFTKEYIANEGDRLYMIINYLIFLRILHNSLGVNYYYVQHATNFVNPKLNEIAIRDDASPIKSSGIVIASKHPLLLHFKRELSLFISTIFRAFDEIYYDELIVEARMAENIRSHEHTLFNIIPHLRYNMEYLNMQLDMLLEGEKGKIPTPENVNIIKKVHKEELLVIKILDLILKSSLGSDKEHALSKKRKLSEVIEFLVGYTRALRDKGVDGITFQQIENADYDLDDVNVVDVFTVFYNLISNANRASLYQKEVTISISQNDLHYVVLVKNAGRLPKNNRFFEMVNEESYNFPREYSGLNIVKRKIRDLGWILSADKDSTTSTVTFTVKIPK